MIVSRVPRTLPEKVPVSGGYSVRMRKNTDQNNSEYAHISRSGIRIIFLGTSKNAKYNAKYKFIRNSVECVKNPSRI